MPITVPCGWIYAGSIQLSLAAFRLDGREIVQAVIWPAFNCRVSDFLDCNAASQPPRFCLARRGVDVVVIAGTMSALFVSLICALPLMGALFF